MSIAFDNHNKVALTNLKQIDTASTFESPTHLASAHWLTFGRAKLPRFIPPGAPAS